MAQPTNYTGKRSKPPIDIPHLPGEMPAWAQGQQPAISQTIARPPMRKVKPSSPYNQAPAAPVRRNAMTGMPPFQGPPARASLPASALNSLQAAYQARALNYANAARPVMGIISGANRANDALAGTGLDQYTNPVLGAVNDLSTKAYGALAGQAPVMSYPYQLQKLLNEGWYTPRAQTGMAGVPVEQRKDNAGTPFYFPGSSGFLGLWSSPQQINLPADYWQRQENINEPWRITEDLRHEFGHYFDVGPGGGNYSGNSQFINAANKTDAEFFPGGKTGKPLIGGWPQPGNETAEMYAYVGQNPYWFRKLSQWYPQYTSTAYQMPAFAGSPDSAQSYQGRGAYMFEPYPENTRGPYTDIANKNRYKRITMPDQTPLYYDYQRGAAAPPQ